MFQNCDLKYCWACDNEIETRFHKESRNETWTFEIK